LVLEWDQEVCILFGGQACGLECCQVWGLEYGQVWALELEWYQDVWVLVCGPLVLEWDQVVWVLVWGQGLWSWSGTRRCGSQAWGWGQK
jgi:hypothetical protein